MSGRELLRHDAEGSARFDRDGQSFGLVFTDRSVAVGKLILVPAARTLANTEVAPLDIVFAPDERWLAQGVHEGLKVLELPTGRELVAPTSGARRLVVEPGGKSLITTGTAGLLRWPVQEELETAKRRLQIGPPQLLSRSCAGPIGGVSLSADGPLHGTEACVWDIASGTVLRRFSHASSVMSAMIGFSPDGPWCFFSSGLECSLFRIGSWAHPVWSVRRNQPLGLGTPFSFSRDGELLAMTLSTRTIRLVEVSTGEELATLEEPDGGNITDVQWSPSGHWIAAGLQNGELKMSKQQSNFTSAGAFRRQTVRTSWTPLPGNQGHPLPTFLRTLRSDVRILVQRAVERRPRLDLLAGGNETTALLPQATDGGATPQRARP